MRYPQWSWRLAYLWHRSRLMRAAGFTRAERKAFLGARDSLPCPPTAAQWRLMARFDRAAYDRWQEPQYLRTAIAAEQFAADPDAGGCGEFCHCGAEPLDAVHPDGQQGASS